MEFGILVAALLPRGRGALQMSVATPPEEEFG
jgi:hypothetical protein